MPDRPRRFGLIAVTGVLALAFLVTGGLVAARANDYLARTSTVVDGIPLTTLRSTLYDSEQPGVIVAHGFAASSTIMDFLANTLARNGFVVVLLDFAGHGASQRRLDLGASETLLAADLEVAVRHLRSQPRVDAERIVLLGHSMGARAVVRYAVDHPDIAATVAISLGDGAAAPDGAAGPHNLLLLVGANEFPRFRSAAEHALAARDPSAPDHRFGVTYGDRASGTARRAETVPGVEHISILFAHQTAFLATDWLSGTVRPGTGLVVLPAPDRVRAGGLLLLALILGFYPLAAVLLRGRSRASGTFDWRALGVGLGGGAVLGIVAGALVPDTILGLRSADGRPQCSWRPGPARCSAGGSSGAGRHPA